MPKYKMAKRLLLSIGILGITAISFLIGRSSTSWIADTGPLDLEHNETGSGHKFISPLLECESVPAPPKFDRIRRAELAVNSAVQWAKEQGRINSASVYFRDLNNGPWFGIHEKDPFVPASLLKLPLMMTYLELAQSDPSRLDRKITYVGDPNAPPMRQNFVYAEPLKLGEPYSIRDLLERMITTSDNAAMSLLVGEQEKASFGAMEKVYTDLGIDIPGGANYEIDAVTYSRFLRVLYNSTYLSRAMSEYALEILSRSGFSEGLQSGVPAGILVSHKFGERTHPATGERHLHDCGIVYAPDRPYLLCVMTRGKEFKPLASLVSDIAKVVYREMQHPAGEIDY